ncbi:MAG: SurA N-terminal domain-containing protein [Sterolibacterium sp.]|nr:SurA N-terminal domain-containing protein [Sterolibacterium sp.]MBP9799400.1 SurA N-terminal domain-containing protein [Sterolibacterium sp.]
MFDYVQNNRRAVQFFLALIILPFAFFGIESFVNQSSGDNIVAEVGSARITTQELQTAVRERQDQLRQQLGRDFPAAMLDTPELRRGVLDTLITQRMLLEYAAKAHLIVGDEQIGHIIRSAPEFQDEGQFSRARYDSFLATQGMSPQQFEHQLRQRMSWQQMLGNIQESVLGTAPSANLWIAALQETREVSEARLKPEDFIAQVKLAPDAAKKYYDANLKSFESPAQLRAEYLTLSPQNLASQITVSDTEIADWYRSHADRFRQGEERRASHILILADKSADAATLKAAQDKAAGLLAQLRKNPKEFDTLARQFSQDPGSAAKGGDLGWFAHGTMVKPFEEAAFTLKTDEISGLVRSDFGFHILHLTGIKPGHERPLAEVRNEISDEIKRESANKKYAEQAESFSNMVYEQPDSLKPVVEKFHLTLQESPWLGKTGGEGPLGNAKLLSALFSDDAIKNQRNTEAVEVAPNTLISARVKEYKPATQLAFDSVKAAIEQRLVREESTRLAQKEGESRLGQLLKGSALALSWGPSHAVSRLEKTDLTADALRAIFKVDTGKLPGYAGAIANDGSYVLYRINQAKPATATGNDENIKKLRENYARAIAEEEIAAWLDVVRQKYPSTIHQTVLDSKDKP